MKLHILTAIAGAFMATGCAHDPLVFASGVTVGVGVKVSASSNNPINITVGYDQLDATYVPVTTDPASKISPIRACASSAAANGADCAGGAPRAAPSAAANAKRARWSSIPRAVSTSIDAPSAYQLLRASLPLPPTPPGQSNGQQSDAKSDALSVYSSFDGNISAGASAPISSGNAGGNGGNVGVGLGKVFATGIAAQYLTSAQEQFLSYKGQALVYNAGACLDSLAKALTGPDGKPARAANDDEILMWRVGMPANPPNTPQKAQQQNGQPQQAPAVAPAQ